VEVFSSKIEISGKTFLYSIIHDISDRKQISEALQESEANLKLLLNTVPIPVFYKDIEGRYIGFNKAFETFLGKSKEQLVGKSLFDISPPELAKVYHAQDVELFEKPGIQVYESQVRDSNNVLHNVIFHKASLINTQGSINGLIGAIIDITERKQVEAEKAELEVQNRQLQKAESLGRMAGAIAHHFNNQLYAVMGNLEMAMDDLPRGADISETLAEANKAAHKAAEVSRLMLTYLGQTPGKHEPIDLSEAYRKSLTLLLAAAPKGMILNADFPSSGPIINADAGQMQQILTNLITNAWESISGNQETIALTVKMVSHADIPTSKRFPIDWQPQKIAYACLEVSDTGCGITNKDIEKLFDPFFTTKFTGRGLGLPVVMGIVKAHDGGITVKSEPGQGSVFQVFLPVSTEELPIQHDLPVMSEALRTGKTEKISKIEGGGTVLLIEDEEQVCSMAKIMLTRLGYTVLEAKDGIEAVEIFQLHQDEIRCVLSDLTMPRMDGWETLSALRKLSPDIPVILSSGYDEAQVMAGEHTEQPNAFLGKPYQLKGLRETISRVLAE
jgi:PAS domain S-box-containing protein